MYAMDTALSSRSYLLFLSVLTLCLVATTWSSSSSHECRVEKSRGHHKGDNCVYNIHVSHDNECGSFRGRRHFRPTYRSLRDGQDHDGEQNDKMDDMEKTFSFMADAHEKRLKDLEGTVRDLLGSDSKSFASLIETSADSRGRARNGNGIDNDMLSRLHKEFDTLRTALKQKTEQLFDTQLRVNETEKMLEKSQVDIFSTGQKLLDAENKVAILQRERSVLKNQLKDGSYRMGISAARATDCEAKLSDQQDQLLKLIRSENILTEEKMTCELLLNMSREEVVTLEDRQKEMKVRHGRVKGILNIRERELIDCYAAKTQTFCGFEDPNLCGFTQPNDTSDFFDWDWGEGRTPSSKTGPSIDHTCGTKQGHYMYIEASAKSRGNNAIIYSPLYRGLKQQCLSFYYHMNGRHIGTLNVYAKARGGGELASVWRAYGNQGDLWSVARLSIPKELARAGYQIAFEGITENGYQGDMAIDDVSVVDGLCEEEGAATVSVSLNTTLTHDVAKDAKRFARNMKRDRLQKIRRKKKRDNN